MNELHKLIALSLAALLLAPFGYAFWRIASHRPFNEDEASAPQSQSRGASQPSPGGNFAAESHIVVESIYLTETTASWLQFYPRRWVGILGLLGTASVLAALIVSLFLPGRGVAASFSAQSATPSTEEAQDD